MQARIIDFASDKFVKSLGKIDKEDVKSFYSTLSSKFGKENGSSSKSVKKENENEGRQIENEVEVTSVGESSAMLNKKPEEIQESSTDDVDGKEDSPRGFAISLTNRNRCSDRR